MSVHIDHEHANERKEHCRTTVADFVGLALRDQADMMTGDFNQVGGDLEECT